jgi:hypothetical protein
MTITTTPVQAATNYGKLIARHAPDLVALATYGYKGVTGYEAIPDADLACRNAAQDEAKRRTATL